MNDLRRPDQKVPGVRRARILRWLLLGGCVLFLWGLKKYADGKIGVAPEADRSAAVRINGGAAGLRDAASAIQSENPAPERTIPTDATTLAAVVANRPHQVGYRRTRIRFTNAAGVQQTRQLDVWYPTQETERRHDYRGQVGSVAKGAAPAPGRHPMLIFSHGYLGASDQSIFLTEACARAGYIVASMNHTDALFNRRDQAMPPPRFEDFANWTDEKYRDRQEDVTALLNWIRKWNGEAGSDWEGRIAADAIGGMGHSLGGYTLLGMAGGWKSWKEARLKTVVLLSPFAQPFGVNGNLAGVTIPVMMQGGTLDIGITPFLPPIYEELGGTKCLLVLKNETHFGWTNLISLGKTTQEAVAAGNAELMVKHTIDFFDQHLLGRERSKDLKATDSRLESYRLHAN